MSLSLQDLTNIATITGVLIALLGIGILIRQMKDSTASRYVEILLHSTNEYATEEMLKAVRLVRETPLERYCVILERGEFTSPEWVARRKVSAYWQT